MFDYLLTDPENQRVREVFKEHGIGNKEQKFIKYLISGEESHIGTAPANDQVRVIVCHSILHVIMKSKFSALVYLVLEEFSWQGM